MSHDPHLAPDTTVGEVQLVVSDLDRSVGYYTGSIGLDELDSSRGESRLGKGDQTLLVLQEKPGAKPVHSYAGLFHFAILLPDRPSLGRWLAHAIADGVAVEGASDHIVSEALYLSDPDGHGIEIYADRPRSQWEGRVDQIMGNAPLDHQGLLEIGEATGPYDGMPIGTKMGHVHLQVADIPSTVSFYRDVLGFDVMAMWDSAAFMSAGGYHHHIGANIWNSRGRGFAPDGSAALRSARIVVVDSSELDRLRERLDAADAPFETEDQEIQVEDPSGIKLVISTSR